MSSFRDNHNAPPLRDASLVVEHLLRDAELLSGDELARQLHNVLQSLYLLFKQGYKASAADRLMHEDLSQKVSRLAGLLAHHPAGDQPNYLFYAVLGELEARMNDPLAAAGYFRKSLQLAELKSEQSFLLKRFRVCEEQLVNLA